MFKERVFFCAFLINLTEKSSVIFSEVARLNLKIFLISFLLLLHFRLDITDGCTFTFLSFLVLKNH